MSFFMFGGAYLRDKPTLVRLTLKTKRAQIEYVIDDDHGVMMNPGEPVAYCHSFHAPGAPTPEGASVDTVRHIRILEITPWEMIEAVEFEYPPVEQTDPGVWTGGKQVPVSGGH
jgi:hypothetical protein